MKKIVILGWGSLIWDPRDLPREGTWQFDGPLLPVEFSRISRDCRLTLVIDEINGESVKTFYVRSPRTDIADAVRDLQLREGTTISNIGFVDLRNKTDSSEICSSHKRTCEIIEPWAIEKEIDGVVWTALKSNFKEQTNQEFTVDRALAYLNGLPKTSKKNAHRYINKAPEEIMTPLRKRLLEESDHPG